jgi:gamma-glutamylcyclotransferase (GGCT)/AIG2-like uncharacterized protein YtfP
MHRILAEGASFVGQGTVPGALYDLGWHPGAVRGRDDALGAPGVVRGELYLLLDPERTLALLDEYEGCGPADPEPHRFVRERAQVRPDRGGQVISWIYWYRGGTEGVARIESGDWAAKVVRGVPDGEESQGP